MASFYTLHATPFCVLCLYCVFVSHVLHIFQLRYITHLHTQRHSQPQYMYSQQPSVLHGSVIAKMQHTQHALPQSLFECAVHGVQYASTKSAIVLTYLMNERWPHSPPEIHRTYILSISCTCCMLCAASAARKDRSLKDEWNAIGK